MCRTYLRRVVDIHHQLLQNSGGPCRQRAAHRLAHGVAPEKGVAEPEAAEAGEEGEEEGVGQPVVGGGGLFLFIGGEG